MRFQYDLRFNNRLKSPSIEKSDPYDQLTWQSGLNLLQYSLLPILSQQIKTLSRLLPQPLDICRDDTPLELEMILKLQVKIDHTLSQITEFVAVICPRPPGVPAQTDDNHLEDSKESCSQGLLVKIINLNQDICTLFDDSSQLIKGINYRGWVTRYTGWIKKSIKAMIGWLKRSEFHHIQHQWEVEVDRMDGILAKLTKLINPTITKPVEEEGEEKKNVEEEEDQFELKDLSEPAIKLAHSAMPIIKLSRLFFKKLSRIGNYKFSVEKFTEMSSNQLWRLERSAADISHSIIKLTKEIIQVDVNDQAHGNPLFPPASALTQTVEDLHPIFDSSILMIILYVVPLIDTSPQDHHSLSQSDIDLKTCKRLSPRAAGAKPSDKAANAKPADAKPANMKAADAKPSDKPADTTQIDAKLADSSAAGADMTDEEAD
ncbi:hypothetical protein Pst134EA_024296 [Puccinia striiformis f. sp. tritici]|uniref:hypothetical protein n=1 Tax=Puccinia striiformis f. sp. tritici TaxID=168172 RepID=UPI0020076CE2|nr:hypothetical protein Pst134EA_024296 [Puccinia striiformis f. sp. tritici]KAH9453423.1 hypothetical protein Pst134EA_024296 [Puccinia striiformis f. sp. tritici]